MNIKKFLTSTVMFGAYVSAGAIAVLIPGVAPAALGALGLVALGRSSVASAAQVFAKEDDSSIVSPLQKQWDEGNSWEKDDEFDSDYNKEKTTDEDFTESTEELGQSALAASRELLTNAPTASPAQVTNCNPSGSGSWSGAVINARNSGGALPVTFSTSAAGCTTSLSANINSITSIIKVDVAGTGTSGFTLGLEGYAIYFTGSNPVGFNITSSSGAGSITFISGGGNFYQSGTGSLNFIVGAGATAIFSTNAQIYNAYGSNLNFQVKPKGVAILTDQSYILNSQNGGGMTVTVDPEGILMMSKGGYFMNRGTGAGIANINGFLSMDTGKGKPYGTAFFFMKVQIGSNGILASGIKESSFESSTLEFADTAMHQVTLGADWSPILVGAWAPATSNITFGGILNVVSNQTLDSLRGNSFTLAEEDTRFYLGSKVAAKYVALKFNSSAVNLPYEIHSENNSVTIFFSTFAPTSSPSFVPSWVPSATPSTPPSPIPSVRPTTYPTKLPTLQTQEPSKEPSGSPSKTPSAAPSKEPSSKPSAEPSLAPSKVPSAAPSAEPSTPPTLQPTSCSQLHSDCNSKIVQSKCVTASYNYSYGEEPNLDSPYATWFRHGQVIKNCPLEINCTVTSRPANFSATQFQDANKPSNPNVTSVTSNFVPEGVYCEEIRGFNCSSVVYMEADPAPVNLPAGSSYTLEGRVVLNCYAFTRCGFVSGNCTHASRGGSAQMGTQAGHQQSFETEGSGQYYASSAAAAHVDVIETVLAGAEAMEG